MNLSHLFKKMEPAEFRRSVRQARAKPLLYLRTVLAKIAEHPIKRIEELLPWNFAASLQIDSSQAA